MIKKKKLLICALLMSMVVSFMPGMESNAAELSGEDQVTATLQDENSQRLEEQFMKFMRKKVLLRKERHHKMQCFWQKHPGRVK